MRLDNQHNLHTLTKLADQRCHAPGSFSHMTARLDRSLPKMLRPVLGPKSRPLGH
ncbi:hypothetical protein THTE_1046 [Thermogutta terrifontis]|uniref:Uncharacterized protein n=1 Tax=Thermogutta terrifontis TaxID=1331910 RepID=A0A286RCG6_9BACT|nr:hypothetical protein THTE_1046 [Thermogutta terrifontis]